MLAREQTAPADANSHLWVLGKVSTPRCKQDCPATLQLLALPYSTQLRP